VLCAAALLAACAPRVAGSHALFRPRAARPSAQPVQHDDARELATMLPPDADRCVVTSPALLKARDLPVGALLSQLDDLPWSLALPVSAYARAELQPTNDRKRVREYIRFVEPGRARIRKELDRVLEPRLAWEGPPRACKDELTCVVVQAHFIDDRTVLLATGDWPYGEARPRRTCEWLLGSTDHALEVGARLQDFVGGSGDGRGSVSVVELHGNHFERVIRRLYADEAAADAALRRGLSGVQDVPMLAGVAVDSELTRSGTAVEQRVRGSIEDLWLALEDRERLRHALNGDVEPVTDSVLVDVRDPELVRLHVDNALLALLRMPAEERGPGLSRLDDVLVRARRESPRDEGLSRRHFELRVEQLRDACGAADVAEQQLSSGGQSDAAWRMSQRRALAGCDAERLRVELARTYELSVTESTHMASELSAQVSAGHDYERAEWGYRTALDLAHRSKKQRLVPSSARVPLSALPRMLAYLARLSDPHAAHDLGVHILAFSEAEPLAAPAASRVWMAETNAPGRPAVVLAAATWDESQLAEEGEALAARFTSGPLEITLAIDVIGATHEGVVVRLAGSVESGELLIERASRPLAQARWDQLTRYLVRPLEHMVGAQFPPDELLLQLASHEELEHAASLVQVDRGMGCEVDGLSLRCKGPLDDSRAAARALVRVSRVALGREARALWGESE
jgi:hypothetical protein